MGTALARFRELVHLLGFARDGATDPKSSMSTDSRRGVIGIGEIGSDPSVNRTQVENGPDWERIFKERDEAIQQMLAGRKPEVIQQGVEAYHRDLPRLLGENCYLQHVAYRGGEMVAIAGTHRQLWKKLRKMGLADTGELFTTVIEPLEIDEEDEIQNEDRSSDTYLTRVECDPELDLLMKERAEEVERIFARQNRELIQQGIEAYQRDLPKLLAEDRYLQHVAYRGNQMVAIATTERKLWKKLEKLGLTDMGELYTTVIAPLQIDEEDEIQSEDSSVGLTQP